jgi:hypothetical protein
VVWLKEHGLASAIGIPHWVLTLIAAAGSVAHWYRWRFSLRTLLVAMTLAAVGLGAILHAVWWLRSGCWKRFWSGKVTWHGCDSRWMLSSCRSCLS